MRANGQEYDCAIFQPFTEAVLAFNNGATLFANDKDDAEIAIYSRTATATQIKSTCPRMEP